MEQMVTMLNDKRVPKDQVEHLGDLRTMVKSWNAFDNARNELKNQTGSDAFNKRKQLKVAFSQWGKAYIRRKPRARAFWHRVIEPELELDAGDLTEGL